MVRRGVLAGVFVWIYHLTAGAAPFNLSTFREVRIGLVLPKCKVDERNSMCFGTGVAINISIEEIKKHKNFFGNREISFNVTYRDSECDEAAGPLAVIDIYLQERPHVYFGPACDYALAPVARYSPHWNIPIVTAGGWVQGLNKEKNGLPSEYSQLTRIGGSFSGATAFYETVFDAYDFNIFSLVFPKQQDQSTLYRFVLEPLYFRYIYKEKENYSSNSTKSHEKRHKSISERLFFFDINDQDNPAALKKVLRDAQLQSRGKEGLKHHQKSCLNMCTNCTGQQVPGQSLLLVIKRRRDRHVVMRLFKLVAGDCGSVQVLAR